MVVASRDPFELPELDHPTRELAPPAESTHDLAFGPKIAEGGMAEIRLAFLRLADGTSRSVVLKRIRPELRGDVEIEAMFREEMRISALLDHPNIVQAIGAGTFEGEPYIVFELLDALSLRELGMLSMRAALDVACGVARALVHGAQWEVVHRDISPENVLVTREGVVKLLDFGIARFRGRELETVAGELKGKERYMAPEQRTFGEVDARADLYALGVMLGELQIAPRDSKLDQLQRRLTADDPNLRPSSAADLLAELESLRPRHAREPSLEELINRPPVLPTRSPMRAWLFWSLAAIWCVGIVIWGLTIFLR